MTRPELSPSRELCRWAVGVHTGEIGSRARHGASRTIVDRLGVVIADSRQPLVDATEADGSGRSTLVEHGLGAGRGSAVLVTPVFGERRAAGLLVQALRLDAVEDVSNLMRAAA